MWHPAVRAMTSTSAGAGSSSSPSLSPSSLTSPSNAAVLGGVDIAAASVANLNSSSASISEHMAAEAGINLAAAPSTAASQTLPQQQPVWYISGTTTEGGATIIQVRTSSPQLQGLDNLLGLPPLPRPRRLSPRLSPLPHYSPHTTVNSVTAERIEDFDLSPSTQQRLSVGLTERRRGAAAGAGAGCGH